MVCLKWPVEVMLITLELIVAMEKGIERAGGVEEDVLLRRIAGAGEVS